MLRDVLCEFVVGDKTGGALFFELLYSGEVNRFSDVDLMMAKNIESFASGFVWYGYEWNKIDLRCNSPLLFDCSKNGVDEYRYGLRGARFSYHGRLTGKI